MTNKTTKQNFEVNTGIKLPNTHKGNGTSNNTNMKKETVVNVVANWKQ